MSLILEIDEGDGKAYMVEATQSLVIGRDPRRATVILHDDFVSREHATITRRTDGLWVFIHRGRNASILNDTMLNRPGQQELLHDRCVVVVGKARIRCLIEEEVMTEIIGSRHLLMDNSEFLDGYQDESEDCDSDVEDDELLADTRHDMPIPRLNLLTGEPEEVSEGEVASSGATVQLHALPHPPDFLPHPDLLPHPDNEISMEVPLSGRAFAAEPLESTTETAHEGADPAHGSGYETLDLSEAIREHLSDVVVAVPVSAPVGERVEVPGLMGAAAGLVSRRDVQAMIFVPHSAGDPDVRASAEPLSPAQVPTFRIESVSDGEIGRTARAPSRAPSETGSAPLGVSSRLSTPPAVLSLTRQRETGWKRFLSFVCGILRKTFAR